MAPSYVRRSRSDRNHSQALSGGTKRPYQSNVDSHRSAVESTCDPVVSHNCSIQTYSQSNLQPGLDQPYQEVSIGLQTVPLVLSSAPQNGHESYANESITQNYISLAFGHVSLKPTKEWTLPHMLCPIWPGTMLNYI